MPCGKEKGIRAGSSQSYPLQEKIPLLHQGSLGVIGNYPTKESSNKHIGWAEQMGEFGSGVGIETTFQCRRCKGF